MQKSIQQPKVAHKCFWRSKWLNVTSRQISFLILALYVGQFCSCNIQKKPISTKLILSEYSQNKIQSSKSNSSEFILYESNHAQITHTCSWSIINEG